MFKCGNFFNSIDRDQKIALANNGVVYYIHSDHLNTPQVITDANQQVVWMGDYEPFGKLAANQTNSIELFSHFPGQYLDTETGLYYNYFRDYDPSIGRYIESDPIGLGGGINTYGYAYQNPINNYDPDGQLVWFGVPVYIWIAGGGAVTAGAVCYGTNCGQAMADAANSVIPKTKYKWVRCTVEETNACKNMCDMQAKSMKSCMSKVKSGPGVKEGQVLPEIGKLPGSISCECNDEPDDCPKL